MLELGMLQMGFCSLLSIPYAVYRTPILMVCWIVNEFCYCVLQLRVMPGARTWVLRKACWSECRYWNLVWEIVFLGLNWGGMHVWNSALMGLMWESFFVCVVMVIVTGVSSWDHVCILQRIWLRNLREWLDTVWENLGILSSSDKLQENVMYSCVAAFSCNKK